MQNTVVQLNCTIGMQRFTCPAGQQTYHFLALLPFREIPMKVKRR